MLLSNFNRSDLEQFDSFDNLNLAQKEIERNSDEDYVFDDLVDLNNVAALLTSVTLK